MYCAKSAVTSHGPGKDFNSGHSNGWQMTSRACEALAHGFIGFMGDLYLGCSEKPFFWTCSFGVWFNLPCFFSVPFGMVEPSKLQGFWFRLISPGGRPWNTIPLLFFFGGPSRRMLKTSTDGSKLVAAQDPCLKVGRKKHLSIGGIKVAHHRWTLLFGFSLRSTCSSAKTRRADTERNCVAWPDAKIYFRNGKQYNNTTMINFAYK